MAVGSLNDLSTQVLQLVSEITCLLCSIFQYVIKWWLRALQLGRDSTVAHEYTYRNTDYIIRTMNTKHELCPMAFLLQAVHKIAVSCSKTFIVSCSGK